MATHGRSLGKSLVGNSSVGFRTTREGERLWLNGMPVCDLLADVRVACGGGQER
jgi:hypothetical protein